MFIYIATHNITGKKYFGKTIKYFTVEDLQKKYHGSGVYWNRHKKKYGEKDVTMEIYQICSLNESDEDYVKPIALKFSEENNIVESEDWANGIVENGIGGGCEGYKHTNQVKIEMVDRMTGQVSARNIETNENIIVDSIEFNNNELLVGICKGAKLSDEHKAKISPEGRVQSEECKRKIGNAHRGKLVSEETREKLRNVVVTQETRYKLSEAATNQKRIECPHCDKKGISANMYRWHFDNCKYK